jgi:hypothetical protein
MSEKRCRHRIPALSLFLVVVIGQVAAVPSPMMQKNAKAGTSPTPSKTAPDHNSGRTSNESTGSTGSNQRESKKAGQSDRAGNAGICAEIRERLAGWSRIIADQAVHKAKAEVELENCRMRDREHRNLPGVCKQYEDQIADWHRQLEKSKAEAIREEKLLTHYDCK